MFKKAIILLSAAVLLNFCPPAEAKAIDEKIYIAPAGPVDQDVLQKIKSSISAIFPMKVSVEIVSEEALPKDAYNSARGQYNAALILEAVAARNNLATTRESMIVVTASDLYYADAGHVLGMSNPKTKICIISLARLSAGKLGRNSFLEKAAMSASMELGHVLGLKECSDPKCIMYLSKDTADDEKIRTLLCHDCKKRLRSRYVSALVTMPSF